MSNKFDKLTKGLAQSVSRRAALRKFGVGGMALATVLFVALAQAESPAQTSSPIPWSQIGAKAGADYKGEGLTVSATEGGARLHCVFQRLDGEVTREGLWLMSVLPDTPSDRFHVVAVAIGNRHLARSGTVTSTEKMVRFSRPGLVEEYAVSMDGVRQDFVVESRPAGEALLRLGLAVAGAKVEASANSARLVLPQSGRKIAYSRLKVTDANGRELPAWMEVTGKSELGPVLHSSTAKDGNPNFEIRMAVVVDDSDAVYPVRIDPTFSDANWISMGGYPGVNGSVFAVAADAVGNVYVGGLFSLAGGVLANNIAKWDGTHWSALASGVNDKVQALAVLGSDLYAGGGFTTAGGTAANYIAKWNGTSWSALGSGMNNGVLALAVSDSDLYAGGGFTTAGGTAANYIAKWNGTSWSALGSGMNWTVHALVVSGTNLYAGGGFTTAGGGAARSIAKWNGSSWTRLGAGLGARVLTLAVLGSDLYAGGEFITLDSPANYIAKWNGTVWSALGSGMNWSVYALAVLGGDLYAGGIFTTAGGNPANGIAKWDGSSWSALESGLGGFAGDHPNDPPSVYALGVSGSNLFGGGFFKTAGNSAAVNIAKWNGTGWLGLLGPSSAMDDTVHALAVSGSDLYAGGGVHNGRWQRGQLRCQMEREQLVGAGFRNGWRWNSGYLCENAGNDGQ